MDTNNLIIIVLILILLFKTSGCQCGRTVEGYGHESNDGSLHSRVYWCPGTNTGNTVSNDYTITNNDVELHHRMMGGEFHSPVDSDALGIPAGINITIDLLKTVTPETHRYYASPSYIRQRPNVLVDTFGQGH